MSSRTFRVGRSRTGLGLFATKPFKRNAYIATYRGRFLTAKQSAVLENRGASYLFVVKKNLIIDGSSRRNLARYVNHSCRPNARTVGRDGGIVIVADRPIEPGEEITYHYGEEFLQYFRENGGCQCTSCRARKAARRRKLAAERREKIAAGRRKKTRKKRKTSRKNR